MPFADTHLTDRLGEIMGVQVVLFGGSAPRLAIPGETPLTVNEILSPPTCPCVPVAASPSYNKAPNAFSSARGLDLSRAVVRLLLSFPWDQGWLYPAPTPRPESI